MSDSKGKGPDQSEDPMAKSRAAVEAARNDSSGRVYRVYCDGIFDLFHLGHMRMLEQAKKSLGDPNKVFLIAGVCDDEMTQRYKGKVVMNHKLRCDTVSHCKWVDLVAPDAPWVINDEFLNKYQIDFVAHDALPYKDSSGASADGDVYGSARKQGKFLETQRTEGISTSDIIVSIVKDYDEYVRRNLDRGYTKEQLNVGTSWEFRANMRDRQKKVRAAVEKARKEYRVLSHSIRAFMRRFNPDNHTVDGFDYAPSSDDDSGSSSDEHPQNGNVPVNPSPTDVRPYGLKPTVKEVFHHGFGFLKASGSAILLFASYLNPLSYCPRKNKNA
jgi:cytidyltransferase-like protein